MDLYEAMESRYSVRKYLDKPVEEDRLQRVLNAGRIAPSGRNLQQWKFVVVRDAELRKTLGEVSDQPWIAHAPVLIAVVSTEPERMMFCKIPAGPVDCAIAIDHMTLAAVAEGLGTCWLGHFDQDACCEVLDIPPTAKIIEMLALGYPADSRPAKKRKSLDEVVCWEKYG